VAELQLTNTRAGIVRRPFDTSLSLSVQSLLLVDALQTFGPDHELLVASHRHVSVDSVSGSLRGGACASEPGSPAGSAAAGSPPSQLDLSLALSSLSDTGGGGRRSFVSPTPDRQQSRYKKIKVKGTVSQNGFGF
jgi:vacuolar protein sorting-associated protein 13D